VQNLQGPDNPTSLVHQKFITYLEPLIGLIT
jgi:hypothetical protein